MPKKNVAPDNFTKIIVAQKDLEKYFSPRKPQIMANIEILEVGQRVNSWLYKVNISFVYSWPILGLYFLYADNMLIANRLKPFQITTTCYR
jgi:hypothetical protein